MRVGAGRWAPLLLLVTLWALAALPVRAAGVSGGDWQTSLAGQVVLAVAAAPSDRRIIYGAGPDGLFKSADGGRSWMQTGATPLGPGLIVDPQDALTLYATADTRPTAGLGPSEADNAILKSTSGGVAWQVVYTVQSGKLEGLVADPNRRGAVYATLGPATPDFIMRSLDGGASWTAVTDPMLATGSLSVRAAVSPAALPGAPGLLYVGFSAYHSTCILRTANATADPRPSWACLSSWAHDQGEPDPLEYSAARLVRVAGTAGTHLVYAFWAGADGSTFTRSVDDGPLVDLTRSLPYLDRPGFVPAFTPMALDPAVPDRVYAAVDRVREPPFATTPATIEHRVFLSADRGQSWTQLGRLPVAVHDLALGVHILFAATDQGIYQYSLSSVPSPSASELPVAGAGGTSGGARSGALLLAALPVAVALAAVAQRAVIRRRL